MKNVLAFAELINDLRIHLSFQFSMFEQPQLLSQLVSMLYR